MKKELDIFPWAGDATTGKGLLRFTTEKLPQYGWLQHGSRSGQSTKEGRDERPFTR